MHELMRSRSAIFIAVLYCRNCRMEKTRQLPPIVAAVLDLRAEFEAQLRAVVRVEQQLTGSLAGRDPSHQQLADVLRRELTAMLTNNKNIHDVLVELSTAAETPDCAG